MKTIPTYAKSKGIPFMMMSVISILVLFCSMTAFAQNPLVGTWEFVSIKGVGSDGTPYSLNKANVRITKIITPTHYALIQHMVRNDSLIFTSAHAGPIQFEDNNRFSQTLSISSDPATIGSKSDYTWKLNGNQLIQSVTFTTPDGRKSVIDELVYERVSSPDGDSKNSIIGTWNQLSSEFTLFDGTKGSHSSPAVTRFDIYTPTHWMRIAHRDNKFENAAMGPYTIKKDKVKLTMGSASFSNLGNMQFDLTCRVDANKLYVKGMATNPEGKKMMWNDVFEKVGK